MSAEETPSPIASADIQTEADLAARVAELEAVQKELEAWAEDLKSREEQIQQLEDSTPMPDAVISERQQGLLAAERELADRIAEMHQKEAEVNAKLERLNKEREALEAKYERLSDRLEEVIAREQTTIDRIRAEQTALTQQRELIERENQQLNKRIHRFMQEKRNQKAAAGGDTEATWTDKLKPEKSAAKPAAKTDKPSDSKGGRGWFFRR